MTAGELSGRRLALALALVLLLFAGSAFIFATAQNVWIDESTQLSGMTLPLNQLIPWLTGAIPLPLGVPPDRMPPVSYVVDHAGWSLWGSAPLAFRLFHAAILGGAMTLLLVAIARRFSGRAAFAAGLFLAISPKFIDMAVEIRAYPLFVALTCAQLALLLSGGVAARTGRLALFMLLGVLSAYAHFFGVVATSALFVAVLADAPRLRDAVRALAGYGVMALLWAGLLPFITGATSISDTAATARPGPGDLAAYLVQLLGSAVHMINPFSAALYFGGAGLLIALGAIGLLLRVTGKRFEARRDPAIGLALALSAGVTVTVLASFVIKGFDALAPRYNLWTMPLLAALIGIAADGCIGLPGKAGRWLRLGGVTLLAAGALWTQVGFLQHRALFIHGPSAALEQAVAKAGANSAVVYVAPGNATWAWGYFPLAWRHGAQLTQWLLTPDGRHVVRITLGGDASGNPEPLTTLDQFGRIVVARIDLKTYKDLRDIIAAGNAAPDAADIAPALPAAGWYMRDNLTRPGFYTLSAQTYSHRPAP